MLSRKIAKVLRGKVTPLQIAMACILGALIGCIPGITRAPGLFLTLLALLVVLNANMWIAVLITALAKSISFLAISIQFEIGRFLLDGPTQPIFKAMINAPVLAWFGFEHYAVTGGLVFGLIIGVGSAAVIVLATRTLQTRLGKLEGEKHFFERLNKSLPLRLVVWVLFGKANKETFERMSAGTKKVGNPIRIPGVIGVVLASGLGVVIWMLAEEPLVTAMLKNQLEQANGATVDLESADVDLGAGNVTVKRLAMADPENLSTDILRAETLTADLGTRDVLTKRIAFDLIEVSEASSGEARDTPGRLVRDRPKASEPKPSEPGQKTLEDYIAEAEKWKERLRQAREWLEKAQSKDPGATQDPSAPKPDADKQIRDRIRRQIALHGYGGVTADHLIEGAPTVLIRDLKINGLRLTQLEGTPEDQTFDVSGELLASEPTLLNTGRPALRLANRSGSLTSELYIAAQPGEITRLVAERKGVPGDRVGSMLNVAGQPPVRGGTVDLRLETSLFGALLDGQLQATLVNSVISVAGRETPVDQLDVPIGVSGPIDAPSIAFSDQALADALVAAGKAEAAKRLKEEAGKLLEETGIEEKIGEDAGKKVKGLLDRIGGG